MKLALTLAIIAGGIGIATAAAWKVTTAFPTPTCSGLGQDGSLWLAEISGDRGTIVIGGRTRYFFFETY